MRFESTKDGLLITEIKEFDRTILASSPLFWFYQEEHEQKLPEEFPLIFPDQFLRTPEIKEMTTLYLVFLLNLVPRSGSEIKSGLPGRTIRGDDFNSIWRTMIEDWEAYFGSFDSEAYTRLGDYLVERKDFKFYNPSDLFYWSYLKAYPEFYDRVLNDEKDRIEGRADRQKLVVPYHTGYQMENFGTLYRATDFVWGGNEVHEVRKSYKKEFMPRLVEFKIGSLGYNEFNPHDHLLDELLENFFYREIKIFYPEKVQNQDCVLLADIFTQLIISLIRIDGVIIAGGFPDELVRGFQTRRLGFRPEKRDFDIFFYGDLTDEDIEDIEVKVKEVFSLIDVLVKKVNDSLRRGFYASLSHNSNIISFACRSVFESRGSTGSFGYEFQIIKRVYSSIQEILLGFDLDSSAVALAKIDSIQLKNPKSKSNAIERLRTDSYLGPVCLERYHQAYTYGVNVINPHRQSASYNRRLVKYAKRGYDIFVPGQLHVKYNYFNLVLEAEKVRTHFFADLIRRVYRLSNYETVKDVEKDIYESSYLDRIEGLPKLVEFYVRREFDSNDEEIEDLVNLIRENPKFNFYEHYDYDGQFDYQSEIVTQILQVSGDLKGWRRVNPGTQVTGTFEPTQDDYLSLRV